MGWHLSEVLLAPARCAGVDGTVMMLSLGFSFSISGFLPCACSGRFYTIDPKAFVVALPCLLLGRVCVSLRVHHVGHVGSLKLGLPFWAFLRWTGVVSQRLLQEAQGTPLKGYSNGKYLKKSSSEA